MKSFLKLIRWHNLIIVILTMFMMRYCIIAPVLSRINVILIHGDSGLIPMTLQSTWYDFLILVLAAVLITAGGYVINDYFDIKTDLINRGGVIVGTLIPRRKAMLWHSIFNIAGVAAGFYISWKAGYIWLGLLFLIVSGLLYFYSASYKRQFFIGNLVVALLTAMVPILVVIYEWPALYRYYEVNSFVRPDFNVILYWVGGFAIFAFITTLTREIIKDIEDFEGDKAYGRNTVPVVMGVLASRILSALLVVITLVLLFLVWFFYIHDNITLLYISVLIAFPLLLVLYQLITGRNRRHFGNASNTMKFVMLFGILYSVLVKLILKWNLI